MPDLLSKQRRVSSKSGRALLFSSVTVQPRERAPKLTETTGYRATYYVLLVNDSEALFDHV